jgi:hypothetical protein
MPNAIPNDVVGVKLIFNWIMSSGNLVVPNDPKYKYVYSSGTTKSYRFADGPAKSEKPNARTRNKTTTLFLIVRILLPG